MDQRIERLKEFMIEYPNEAHSVLNAVIFYLERGMEEAAQDKIQFDSDKFTNRKEVLTFLRKLGLISPKYQVVLDRWGILE